MPSTHTLPRHTQPTLTDLCSGHKPALQHYQNFNLTPDTLAPYVYITLKIQNTSNALLTDTTDRLMYNLPSLVCWPSHKRVLRLRKWTNKTHSQDTHLGCLYFWASDTYYPRQPSRWTWAPQWRVHHTSIASPYLGWMGTWNGYVTTPHLDQNSR